MFTRTLRLPDHSFFLFGPRSTGKTTWLRDKLGNALWFNLVLDRDYLPLLQDPGLFRSAVEARPPGSWVVVDEVQRLPSLLREVHDLISIHGDEYRFAMSGSSARKLRRMDVDLLAGRVIERRMFPLTSMELSFPRDISKLLAIGTLPAVQQKSDLAVDLLEAYAGTYLREEIQQEALVKDLGSFARFLRIAAIMNGQAVNTAGIARDAGVARTTVQRYFDTLIDTLVGCWVPGWQPRAKVREAARAKFYLFDAGVARTLANRVRDPLTDLEKGALLETFFLHELRSAAAYLNAGGEISYWHTPSGVEIDFIWSRGNASIAFELKSSARWQRQYSSVLRRSVDEKMVSRAFGIYLGAHVLRDGKVEILPIQEFLSRLWTGRILRVQA
ncbi:MAG: ATP-binding protein [Acidobacteriia bacterium]|nr:ATP-binding protein [Terriglobia bacterium]